MILATISRIKSLRQGNPLSPMLFIIAVDMLAISIARENEDGQVGCLIPHLVEGGGHFTICGRQYSFS